MNTVRENEKTSRDDDRRVIFWRLTTAAIFLVCLTFFGCRSPAKNYRIDFVDRSAAFAPDKNSDPLRLVVEITEDGRLRLNKIETGTVSDLSVLSGVLEALFADRQKTGIAGREVVIDPQGKAKSEDLEKLIKSLASVKASPILVVRDNF